MKSKRDTIIYNDLWARKSAGFLLPLFSLKTEKSLGIGDMGDMYGLIHWAAKMNQSVIQLLPINDTRPGDPSPYAAVSVFATNPLYIDLDKVKEVASSPSTKALMKGWQKDGTMEALQKSERVDYSKVREVKMALLSEGFALFLEKEINKNTGRAKAFLAYAEEEKGWLRDYALFSVIREVEGGKDWRHWPEGLRRREAASLSAFEKVNEERIAFYKWLQWLFDSQWEEMRAYANGKSVYLMGDVSFYPGVDSVEVWANPNLFRMNDDFTLSATSGAPPDQFSADGQDWGTPLYHWGAMEEDDFSWWRARVKRVAAAFDLYRLDHFRGFESYWEVTAGKKASEGRWIKAPGWTLLQRLLKETLYERLIIPLAEDLGDISDEVRGLRSDLGIPGYKTFIFGWGEGEHSGIASGFRYPEDYAPDFLATTGTHDTPTLLKWFDELREDEKGALLNYLALPEGASIEKVKEAIFGRLFNSRARYVILPLQDILGLGEEHRINFPGTFGPHNWSWRMPFTLEELSGDEGELGEACRFLKELTATSGRGRLGEGSEGGVQLLPAPGSIQERRRGEKFIFWAAAPAGTKSLRYTSECTGWEEREMKVAKKLPDGSWLFRGELDAAKPGEYTIIVRKDGEECRVDGCFRVN